MDWWPSCARLWAPTVIDFLRSQNYVQTLCPTKVLRMRLWSAVPPLPLPRVYTHTKRSYTHVKDPVVRMRVRWIMETLTNSACSIDWVARLCHSWLPPRKATEISFGKIARDDKIVKWRKKENVTRQNCSLKHLAPKVIGWIECPVISQGPVTWFHSSISCQKTMII